MAPTSVGPIGPVLQRGSAAIQQDHHPSRDRGGRPVVSDQPQGPDWWLASDGRYYPPQSAPQPGAPPSAWQQPPQQPKRRRTAVWLVVVALLLVFSLGSCAACVALFGGDTDEPTAVVAEPAAEEPEPEDSAAEAATQDTPPVEEPAVATPAVGIGMPARDGQFEFVVQSVETGLPTVGEGFLEEQAQGVFTIVTLTVTNIGDEPRTFTFGNQSGLDSQGRTIDANTIASTSINEGTLGFLEDINPGNSITVKVAYDLPPTEQLTAAELHDSIFSFGVLVALT